MLPVVVSEKMLDFGQVGGVRDVTSKDFGTGVLGVGVGIPEALFHKLRARGFPNFWEKRGVV